MISDASFLHLFFIILKNSVILGFASGVISVFVTTKEDNVFSGTVANATLVGMLLSIIIIGVNAGGFLVIPTVIMSVFTLYIIRVISKVLDINRMVVKSLIASVTFAFCMVLFSYLRHENSSLSSEFDKFILGEASTLLRDEGNAVFYTCLASIIIIFTMLSRIKAVLFSPELASTSRIYTKFYELLIFILTVAITVVGVQIMGIILIPILFLVPAIISRLWVKSFISIIFLSGLIGAFSVGIGSYVSGISRSLSTGPTSILVIGIIFTISILSVSLKGKLFGKKTTYSYILDRGKK